MSIACDTVEAKLSAGPRLHGRHAWWREGEVVVLVGLVALAYFVRISDLTVRGEESRWATVAMEMIRTGDWVVPRQQGEAFLSRPPLGNWLIAACTLARGRCDAVAIRLPTATAVLLVTLLVYAFGRTIMGRLGAFTAALAIASMGEVLQMGRIAESDLLFTFLLTAAWFVWLWGDRRGWPPVVAWVAGYSLTALAALQKGPQAPFCFCGAVGLYLLSRGEWRRLLSPAHGIGVATFVGIIAAWQVPFTLSEGWRATSRIWLNDSTSRFEDLRPLDVARHFLTYPLEVLGCTAPWSLLLFAYLSRHFRRGLGPVTSVVQFLAIATAVGFVPCWVVPTGMTRYVLPLYPGLALLTGLVVDRGGQALSSAQFRAAATLGRRAFVGLALSTPIGMILARVLPLPVVQAYSPSLITWVAVSAVAVVAARAVAVTADPNRRRLRVAVVAVAAFQATAYAKVIVDGMIRRSEDTAAAVARVKEAMAPGERLVSFDPVHHLFAYHFDEPIDLRGEPDPERDRDVTWFCYNCQNGEPLTMPFPSEVLAVIPIQRNRQPVPRDVVVVGRRLDRPAGQTRK